ncbi:TPA: hypothetical protein R3975_004622 [Salmonella enterica subsp. enterica serovar Muenchen]|nr:hypothetical protein [Salmonella enterica subsp. enterica serovar Muenchen]HEC7519871.1 hypothetical protein [Salmonella enterica subsp. enterica serovar Muenchen]HEC7582384.1 hypothetical protein [Salmonella enterica subsp. enterica serovar Muenchen]HEC8717251.1 hypothetical protein [Salmonella enterica subsp. enterica serovar Muenchen]
MKKVLITLFLMATTATTAHATSSEYLNANDLKATNPTLKSSAPVIISSGVQNINTVQVPLRGTDASEKVDVSQRKRSDQWTYISSISVTDGTSAVPENMSSYAAYVCVQPQESLTGIDTGSSVSGKNENAGYSIGTAWQTAAVEPGNNSPAGEFCVARNKGDKTQVNSYLKTVVMVPGKYMTNFHVYGLYN